MNKVENEPEFSSHAFRRALGNFATGVTIITAVSPEGEKVGVTASSFNSLSMDPPLILWSSMKGARSCTVFERATHFAVNILASNQVELSNHFARQQEDKFAGVEWTEGIGGSPMFPDCAGRFQCETYDKFDGGDHWIFVGKVVSFDDFGRPPLCFHQGSYSLVFSHPGMPGKAESSAVQSAPRGRMDSHLFFLMLQAVRSYQSSYSPKLETLGLSLIESRTLLVLNDLSVANAERLVGYLNAPISEVHEAILNLKARGMIEDRDNRHVLTDVGLAKAGQCWDLAASHASQVFDSFNESEVATFANVLRRIIGT